MCTAGTCGLAMCATRLMPVAKKLGSSSAPGIERGELLAEAAADGRDVDPDLFEHLAVHLPANAAAAGRAVVVGAVPRGEVERGVAAGFALDRLELGADAVAERFEPVAGGLLLVVEGKHCRPVAATEAISYTI